MDTNTESQETQNAPEQESVPVVSISQSELEDLKFRASQSSQNFERVKKLEKELQESAILSTNESTTEYEDDVVAKLKNDVSAVKQELAKVKVLESHPELKEVWKEFESFREDPENKGMNMNTAAKAFIVEKGLNTPQRKGLEQTTGGDRVPVSSGMSSDEVRTLREKNFRKYQEYLKAGKIQIS